MTRTSRIKLRSNRNHQRGRRGVANQKISKITAIFQIGVMLLIAMILPVILLLMKVQSITKDLPSLDGVFAQQPLATEIYDRNEKLLYRVSGDEDRDYIKISDVPAKVKWSFLAAEDISFYEHNGIDLSGILRCGIRMLDTDTQQCGGSTITQQLIKKTILNEEFSVERKLKEMILAMRLEQIAHKDQILEAYLNIIPEGSNIYGIKRATDFYFGKSLDQLDLAEISIIAGIPQDPARLSPTKSVVPGIARSLLKNRQGYVLGQISKYKDKINQMLPDDEKLTDTEIDIAWSKEIEYRPPIFAINAPHFVFYVQKLLMERGYNNGKPFTPEDLQTKGLRIYTTLDSKMQREAEKQAKVGVEKYGSYYGADNAALLALKPSTGEVLAMVGSYSYWSDSKPKKCRAGVNCTFEPQVNVLDSLQAYGSTLKPLIYYSALSKGIIRPNTVIPDVPVEIGNYRPKNYEGKFLGPHSARYMLINSRNIPAILLLDRVGVGAFVKEMKNFGYSTLARPENYGLSIAVGGTDLNLIEHAQAFGVFANGGNLVEHEVVLRIEDASGNEIFAHNPKPRQVADPRAVYLLNNMMNGRYGGGGDAWDGRDMSGKTGTSESQKETLFVEYSPEIVVLGWLGNNNNQGMRYGATGFTSARPWVTSFVRNIGNKIPKTNFPRPAGIVWAKDGDYMIAGMNVAHTFQIDAKYRIESLALKQ